MEFLWRPNFHHLSRKSEIFTHVFYDFDKSPFDFPINDTLYNASNYQIIDDEWNWYYGNDSASDDWWWNNNTYDNETWDNSTYDEYDFSAYDWWNDYENTTDDTNSTNSTNNTDATNGSATDNSTSQLFSYQRRMLRNWFANLWQSQP